MTSNRGEILRTHLESDTRQRDVGTLDIIWSHSVIREGKSGFTLFALALVVADEVYAPPTA